MSKGIIVVNRRKVMELADAVITAASENVDEWIIQPVMDCYKDEYTEREKKFAKQLAKRILFHRLGEGKMEQDLDELLREARWPLLLNEANND